MLNIYEDGIKRERKRKLILTVFVEQFPSMYDIHCTNNARLKL